MKTGMNLLLWTGHVTEEHYKIMKDIKDAGFDGAEIPVFDTTVDHYKKVRKELDNLGLKCTVVTIVTPEANPISPDAAVRQAAVDRLRTTIDCCQALGAENMLGPFHSPLAVFSGVPPTEDEKLRAADVLRKAAEHAAKAKVQLCIEYLNRFECYFLTTAADAVALCQRVNHPSFKTMYDTFHAHIEEKDPAEALRACADVLVHIHLSENDRSTPGAGQIAWDETFAGLDEIGYDGWIVIEAFGDALPELAGATKIWRRMFESEEQLARDGAAFIRGKLTS